MESFEGRPSMPRGGGPASGSFYLLSFRAGGAVRATRMVHHGHRALDDPNAMPRFTPSLITFRRGRATTRTSPGMLPTCGDADSDHEGERALKRAQGMFIPNASRRQSSP